MQDEFGRSTWINPLSVLEKNYIAKTSNLLGNIVLKYQILPSLSMGSSFGYNSIISNDMQLNSLNSIRPERRNSTPRDALHGNRNISTWIIEPQLSFYKEIAKGKLDLLVGVLFKKI